jgi:hypothetical protein
VCVRFYYEGFSSKRTDGKLSSAGESWRQYYEMPAFHSRSPSPALLFGREDVAIYDAETWRLTN